MTSNDVAKLAERYCNEAIALNKHATELSRTGPHMQSLEVLARKSATEHALIADLLKAEAAKRKTLEADSGLHG